MVKLLMNWGGAILGFETQVDFDCAPREEDLSLLDLTREDAGLRGSYRYARKDSDDMGAY